MSSLLKEAIVDALINANAWPDCTEVNANGGDCREMGCEENYGLILGQCVGKMVGLVQVHQVA